MLIDFVEERLIRLNIEARDWKDAIKQAAQPLVDANKIEPRYIQAIIDNVLKSGPYIVITPHVALPHAHPDSGVIETSIGIATLKEPVVFGNEDNDPVKYLFCLSAKESNQHLEALVELANFLEDKRIYTVLDNAVDAKEVIDFIKK